MKQFGDFVNFISESRKDIIDALKLDTIDLMEEYNPSKMVSKLENMLKQYNVSYTTQENVIKFGLFRIILSEKGYEILKGSENLGIYKDLKFLEKLVENEYIVEDMVDAISTAQKDKLKNLFNIAIDKVDSELNIEDFAKVIAEIFSEQYGSHLLSKFDSKFKQVVSLNKE